MGLYRLLKQAFPSLLLLAVSLMGLTLSSVSGSYLPAVPTVATVAETESDVRYTVVIDAGHGGEDGGTQSAEGLFEKDANLAIARLLDRMLREAGVQTVMTRSEDILLYDRNVDYHGRKKVLDLAARRQIAEKTENALFISIHMNAFPQTQYHGLQVFYSVNDPNSQDLAERIQSATKTSLQPDNERKIKKGSGIYLLERLECPAVLVECGFLSNPGEAAMLGTEEYQKQVAFVLFYAILSYIS